jgi:radical SAM superfamily enzyme YgiQ (UPF0313 family)
MRAPHVILFTEVCAPGFGRYAGTYRIATELRDKGYAVQTIDYWTKWTTDELKSILSKFVTKECLWVGVSTTFVTSGEVKKRPDDESLGRLGMPPISGRDDWAELVDHMRSINPKIMIVAGGTKASQVPESDKTFDVLMPGQGETSAVALSEALSEDRKVPRIIALPYTDYPNSSIKYTENDIIFPGEHLPVELARGCIFKCSFCNYELNGKKLWEFNRKPHLVREDVERIHDQYGSTGFMFCDDTYNDSLEKVKRYHTEFAKLDYDIQFSSFARADLMFTKWETAKLMYESGLRSVFFGIESLNYESAKSIGKGMDSEKIKDGMYRLKEECPDLIICFGMIVGLPYDTYETLMRNNEWLLRPDSPVHNIAYQPLWIAPQSEFLNNSKLSNDPNKYGFTVDNKGYWTRNGFEEDDAINLSETLNELCASMPQRVSSTEGSFTFFNRYQNLGYTIDDLKHGHITQNDRMIREQQLMEEYKRRLGDI